jgi:pyrroline-5-carboxylate reductase
MMMIRRCAAVNRNGGAAAVARAFTTTGLLDASSPSPSPSSSSPPPIFNKIACIGTGTICSALVEPMIRTGLQPADHFCMYDVDLRALKATAARFPGVQTASSLAQAIDAADVILLAVKPQNLTPAFFAEFRQPHVGLHTIETLDKAILLSVVAGKPMDCFLNAGFKKVVRSMPNTPATIGEGMTVWSATNNLNLLERGKIDAMLSSCGSSVRVPSS